MNNSGGILNYFGDNLFSSLFLQGCFFTICFLLGLSFLFYQSLDLVSSFKKEKNLKRDILELFYQNLKLLFFIFNPAGLFKKLTPFRNEQQPKKETENLKGGTSIDEKGEKDETKRLTFSFVFHGFLSTLILVIIIFASGIITNRVADTLMDSKGNIAHLGLKAAWIKPYGDIDSRFIDEENETKVQYDTELYKNSDKAIRLSSFQRIYPDRGKLKRHQKYEIYYAIKHKLLAHPKWEKYLESTQMLINYSQVLAFSFLTLIYLLVASYWTNILYTFFDAYKTKKKVASIIYLSLSVLGFIGLLTLLFIYDKKPDPLIAGGLIVWMFVVLLTQSIFRLGNSVKLVITFALLAFVQLCYIASGVCWRENEQEFDSKVFGVYKVYEPDLCHDDLKLLHDSTMHHRLINQLQPTAVDSDKTLGTIKIMVSASENDK